MSLSKDEKHQLVHAMYPELNDMQSADYVAPHLITKTHVGRWASLSGSEWKYTCCGATSVQDTRKKWEATVERMRARR